MSWTDAIHQALEACLERGDDGEVYRTLQDATAAINSWLDEWDVRMSTSLVLLNLTPAPS